MTKKRGSKAYKHDEIVGMQTLGMPAIDTSEMFLAQSGNSELSPIDQFIQNTEAINRIYLPLVYRDEGLIRDAGVATTHDPGISVGGNAGDANVAPGSPLSSRVRPELGALVVLGYMSAVESYFRALLRELILVDDHTHSLVEPMNVSFGAARHHKIGLLPEALTEHLSFAGDKNVLDALKSFVGIKGNPPAQLEASLKEFKKVCEIRHCCVHRFGKLGSKTAIALGTESHKRFLEQPFAPSSADLQGIAAVLRLFVKTMNNHIFKSVIERIPDSGSSDPDFHYGWGWVGTWRSDRKRFSEYYRIFSSSLESPPSPSIKDVYVGLRDFVADRRTTRPPAKSHPVVKAATA
ncbi:hypothetical protein AMC87_PC00012 (plasmid) [Rhizobium phaseoli]|uniref:hypothetical protein n=1 Tax=Rhizobium phaseoli TaxID=396 RepID=UPI0007EAAEDA|nr:hypothetical protein [Rhizobium phaseoli]ANL49715.1 hypothetical protein AMC87_PC00012 [Rhizobium phaseoli]